MKKWIIGILVCVLLFILYVYFFIPSNILLSNERTVFATNDGLYRNLTNEKNWQQWWPGNYISQDSTSRKKYLFNNKNYTIDDIQINSLVISIIKDNFKLKTFLHILPDQPNTVKLLWNGTLYTSLNPFTRVHIYLKAKEVNKDMKQILEKMHSYLSKDENIYGISIRKEYVKDSTLIFKNATSKGFPDIRFIYNLINDLKTFIRNKSAQETGFPMLNINTGDSINYLVKVAIPVDKKLPSSGDIFYKWMLGGGNILVAEIKGGNTSINRAFSQLENYVGDHHYVAPAIPFQSLVTDRVKEPDSSKWITRIYYPVMYY